MRRRLTDAQVIQLREDRVGLGLTYRELAGRYGIGLSTAEHLARGWSRRAAGGPIAPSARRALPQCWETGAARQIAILLPEQLDDRLRASARRQQLSVSAAVREAIERYLDPSQGGNR